MQLVGLIAQSYSGRRSDLGKIDFGAQVNDILSFRMYLRSVLDPIGVSTNLNQNLLLSHRLHNLADVRARL